MQRGAIVTGASKGIGRAIAIRLKDEGYFVVSISRSKADVGDLIYQADVADKESDFRIVNEVLEKFGRIDVLVNNAGGRGLLLILFLKQLILRLPL